MHAVSFFPVSKSDKPLTDKAGAVLSIYSLIADILSMYEVRVYTRSSKLQGIATDRITIAIADFKKSSSLI